MSTIISTVEAPARRSIEQTCDELAALLLAVISVVSILTFRDYGLGWDDYTHAEYADLLLQLYRSGFHDAHALSFANLYMYGGGFDMAAALLHKIVPFDLFETRRLLGAIVGVLGIALSWRVARRMAGPLAGLVALIILGLCPTYYGQFFMNPKDAPFAVAMIALMLGLVRLAEEYPAPSPHTILIVGLCAGLSIGSRVLGGLALIYGVIGFLPIWISDLHNHGARETLHRLAHALYVLIPGLVLGYIVMGLIWPWSIMKFDNPIEAVTYFSAFFEKPWKELFDGALVSVPDMPWSYLPTLFALKMPETMIVLFAIGVGAALVALVRRDVPANRKAMLAMLLLAATLPLMIAMVKRPALYNGIRHFVFVIPPMAVLAGVGFSIVVDRVRRYGVLPLLAVNGLFAASLMLPLTEMIRLHPYEYTYFNHVAGTVRAADANYMLDYWGLAFKQASEELRAKLEEAQEVPPYGRKWKVAVCGPQRPAQVALGPAFNIGWDSPTADFAMTLGEFYCKGLNAPVMVEIKRDDVVFARVYDIRGTSISSLLAVPAP